MRRFYMLNHPVQHPAPHIHTRALVWFRRDLRCVDHTALSAALDQAAQVFCVFVFDKAILDKLPRPHDRRVEFIWHAVVELDAELRQRGGNLIVLHDDARHAIPALARTLDVSAVLTHHDDEPFALERDAHVRRALEAEQRVLLTYKDTVIFERQDILTGSGKPYSVFTPYKNAWLKKLRHEDCAARSCEHGVLAAWSPQPCEANALPSLQDLGFTSTNLLSLGIQPGMSGAHRAFEDFKTRVHAYADRRDFPAVKGPSYLSVHLRFGTISVRALVREAYTRALHGERGAEVWLSELIWRDFYMQILANFPHVTQRSFKPQYDNLRWDNDEALWQAWCTARTGYPLVDAAMQQLNQTGYMHNRLRMVVASFLTKDLGIDWRQGEAYFATHLNDFDLAANNGGWQWAASTGCDAQPYFRIFNPVSQSEKFDPEGQFIRRYLPQLAGLSSRAIHAPWCHPAECAAAGIELGQTYPWPVVQHDEARQRTLARYNAVKHGHEST